jgi:segregation and condensation protein A
MATSLAQNAIALLIDLAERGEIDPWNVKVIEVIDRFLSKLQPGKVAAVEGDGRSPYESDLTESGQAFLYASMLLLLKADSLVRQELEAEQTVEEEAEFGEMYGSDAPLPPNLERTLRRRAVAPPTPNRRVTLQELIGQLNVMAAAIADHVPRRLNARRPRAQTRSQAMRTITELAHQENLSEIAAILEQFLAEYWQADSEENWLDFEDLLTLWATTQAQQESAKPKKNSHSNKPPPEATPADSADSDVHDRVGVFWALLFLSAQSKVELAQETFYQDLKVRQLHPDEIGKPIEPPSFVLPD